MKKKVIFLDRDGTINADRGYVHEQEEWEFLPRAVEALKLLQEAGYALAVVTNQSAIAEGQYTEADVHRLHDFMRGELAKSGVHIGAIALCPHGREGTCKCRKPAPGMARTIEQELGAIDFANSWMVGDKELDVGFGKNIGAKTALLRSRYWSGDELEVAPDVVVDSLYEAAQFILRETTS